MKLAHRSSLLGREASSPFTVPHCHGPSTWPMECRLAGRSCCRTAQSRACRAWRGHAPPALYAIGGAKPAGQQCAEARVHADCPPHLAGHFVAGIALRCCALARRRTSTFLFSCSKAAWRPLPGSWRPRARAGRAQTMHSGRVPACSAVAREQGSLCVVAQLLRS